MKTTSFARNAFVAAIALSGLAALTPTAAQAQAHSFTFNKTRPKLVVLLHGVTQSHDQDTTIGVGTTKHARYYWGYEFIKGLQGRTHESYMNVFTPRTDGTMKFQYGTDSGANAWTPGPLGADTKELAPICFPVAFNTAPPQDVVYNNQTAVRNYIRLVTKDNTNLTMVMVNSRDGSKHLMPQVGETIDEIYSAYVATFGSLEEKHQPQIYFVGHSFGGVIARAIMANPTQGDLWGNKLTVTQRSRADYLRSRVVLIQTLSSPHLGCQIGDPSEDVAKYIKQYGYGAISTALSAYGTITSKDYSQAYIKQKTNETVKAALDAVAGERDCLQDLMRMGEYNTGILKPDTLRRPNGELVPIFTSSGRNPGGMYYDKSRSVFLLGGNQWNPYSTLDFAISGDRPAKEAMALNLIEAVLHQKGYGKQGKRPYGTATFADGDRVRSPFMGHGPATARNMSEPLNLTSADLKYVITEFLQGRPYTFNAGDGEWDNDGFLGFDSGHGLGLAGSNWFRVFDQSKYGKMMPWDIDNHGSMMFNTGNGQWIHNELLREAGPYLFFPGSRRSTWGPTDMPVTPKSNVRVEVLSINDIDDDLDLWPSDADFNLRVTVGGTETTWKGPEDVRLVDHILHKIPSFTVTNYPSTIIPIKIEVIERDQPYSYDDTCPVTPAKVRDAAYLYYCTRTGRISGDRKAAEGDIFYLNPSNNPDNRVQLKVRISEF